MRQDGHVLRSNLVSLRSFLALSNSDEGEAMVHDLSGYSENARK